MADTMYSDSFFNTMRIIGHDNISSSEYNRTAEDVEQANTEYEGILSNTPAWYRFIATLAPYAIRNRLIYLYFTLTTIH